MRDRLAVLPSDGICFNYLGQLDNALPADSLFAPAAESTGPSVSPSAARRHLWEIIIYVRNSKLHIEWQYSRAYHRTETVERLASEFLAGLRELVAQCEAPEANSLTLTDFPLAGVDEADLDALRALLANG